jgi:hypothetical protein
MKLGPLYRVTFKYTQVWGSKLADSENTESLYFMLAEGRCEGRITGSFRGANHPLRRSDGTYIPDCQGVIETDDGATILFDYQGYGRTYPIGRRQIVSSATHFSDDERYRWLNDTISVGVGEVREASGSSELVMEWAELIWEPLAE